MACGDARVENSELNFVKPSSEMVPHIVILEEGRGEAVTMNGGVGSGVVDRGHVGGFIQGIFKFVVLVNGEKRIYGFVGLSVGFYP